MRARALARYLRACARPVADRLRFGGAQLRVVREAYDTVGFTPLPRGTKVHAVSEQHGDGQVTGVWLTARDADESAGVVLYLHGGGFVLGSPRTHRHLAALLSQASGMPVLLLDYRRAPEHPYPAAADDALAAYQWLLDQGHPADKVVLASDSAGGHLAAWLLRGLARRRAAMPGAAVFWSPFLDLTCSELDARDAECRDPYIPPVRAREVAALYAGSFGVDHPGLDVFRGPKRRWPPTLVQVGGTECLLADSRRLADVLAAAGVHCELQVWPGQVHVFPAFYPIVPEGRLAIGQAGVFLREVVARPLAA